MAIVADYLILSRVIFGLQVGGTTPSKRADLTVDFTLPTGARLSTEQRGPLLHYSVMHVSGLPQIGIGVEINGVEVHREWFFEGDRHAFVEAPLKVGAPFHDPLALGHPKRPSYPFKLTGRNTIRFVPVLVNESDGDADHLITFDNAVLWFQKEVAAAGA